MQTTDFSGTYDYEKEEAQYAAQYLLDDLSCGHYTDQTFKDAVTRECAHWKKVLPETYNEWEAYFIGELVSNNAPL